jgi:hypothetical protein
MSFQLTAWSVTVLELRRVHHVLRQQARHSPRRTRRTGSRDLVWPSERCHCPIGHRLLEPTSHSGWCNQTHMLVRPLLSTQFPLFSPPSKVNS